MNLENFLEKEEQLAKVQADPVIGRYQADTAAAVCSLQCTQRNIDFDTGALVHVSRVSRERVTF